MISIYWPYKKVPRWLEKVEISGNTRPTKSHHIGFGLIWKIRGYFVVFMVTNKAFMYVNGGGGSVKIYGQGRGVYIFHSISEAIRFSTEVRHTPITQNNVVEFKRLN